MIKFILNLLLITSTIFSQTGSFDFHSPENIKKFADYLFCEGDYLRAVGEYEKIITLTNDTINFKVMLCYSNLELFQSSNLKYNFYSHSELVNNANCLFIKNLFLASPESFNEKTSSELYPFKLDTFSSNYNNKLTSISNLYSSVENISKETVLDPFEENEQVVISTFYDIKKDPPYKSSLAAGTMSAIIPGSGKMYLGEWGDGITALLITGLLTFLAYDNFNAHHNTRAWIFTGLDAFFYGGNIYGSVAAAQIFNARIDFEFNDGLKLFLEKENYFLPEYDFCK
jgi:TM2 domain-containing membrane protein YozV